MTKHTPWTRGRAIGDKSFPIAIIGDGAEIARVSLDEDGGDGDATYILRAVNSHADLVAALKMAARVYKTPHMPITNAERDSILDLLAKVEG